MENIESFYTFMKKCLQNIIILETQYDIQESCLKTKRKKDKGCYVDFTHNTSNIGIQTEDYLDILVGKHEDLKEYSLNFPLITKFIDTTELLKPKLATGLVDYDDSDSNSDDNDTNAGKVVLGEKLETLNKITNFVDSFLSQKNRFTCRKHYFDDAENDLISEISQRKNLKRKREAIENSQTKIFKMDNFNRRKNKQPKRLETKVTGLGEDFIFNLENFAGIYHNENENNSLNGLEKSDSHNSDNDNQQNTVQVILICFLIDMSIIFFLFSVKNCYLLYRRAVYCVILIFLVRQLWLRTYLKLTE